MKKIILSFVSLFLAFSMSAQGNVLPQDSTKGVELSDVLVYATRSPLKLKRLPAKVEVISTYAIYKESSNQLIDLLKNNASLDVIKYPGFSSSIGMRGFLPSNKYVVILENGIPVGTNNLSAIMTDQISQVEVIKGPFSSIYGSNAMGGIINLIPVRNNNKLTGKISLSNGNYSTFAGVLSLGGRIYKGLSFDLSLSSNNQYDDYKIGKKNFLKKTIAEKEILDEKSNGATMLNTSYKVASVRARLGYDFSKDWSLDVIENIFKGYNIGTPGSFWGVYGRTNKTIDRYSTSLVLSGNLGINHFSVTPYFNYENSSNYTNWKKDDEFINYKGKLYTYGGIVQDNIKFGNHQITVGVDCKTTENEGESYSAKDKEVSPYLPGYKTNNLGGFLQSAWNFFDNRLNITAGGRFDMLKFTILKNKFIQNEETSETYKTFSPNIGLRYEFLRGLSVHGSFGTAFTAPDAYQKAGKYTVTSAWGTSTTKGNPNLKPEYSMTVDGGIGYYNKSIGLELDATYFHVDRKDFIVQYTPQGENYKTFKNVDKAKMNGIELTASYNLGAAFSNKFVVRPYVSATYMLDKKQKDTRNGDKWSELKYVRNQTIVSGIQIKAYKFDLNVRSRYLGKRLEDNWYGYYKVRPNLPTSLSKEQPENAKKGLIEHPSFMIFDSSLYYDLTNNITIGLNANNLFDVNYAEKDGYNMPGRNFLAKMTIKF